LMIVQQQKSSLIFFNLRTSWTPRPKSSRAWDFMKKKTINVHLDNMKTVNLLELKEKNSKIFEWSV
jgi:hypothetical protein